MYQKRNNQNGNGPMLNAYPDSMGGSLADIVNILTKEEFAGLFSSFYLLPSVFHTDLDRGFSVINYDLNEAYAVKEDLEDLKAGHIDLKLDFILNHASVLSEQFQDILKNGRHSIYKDFFLDWNQFWEGRGTMTKEGYIRPDEAYVKDMYFRKPGLPFLMIYLPDGSKAPYWNTFYQEVRYPVLDAQDLMELVKIQYTAADALAKTVNEELKAGKSPEEIEFGRYGCHRQVIISYLEQHRKYLGQMDLNIQSPLVWEYYENTLKRLWEYGAKIVRLDAFAYAPKEPGKRNFLNEPETWEVLEKVRKIADQYGLTLLPEIHAGYGEKMYEKIAGQGYLTYDFFLPGLLIDCLERRNGDDIQKWAQELYRKKIRVVNMLGCHDGIPLLDLEGMLSGDRIEKLIELVVARGGVVKNLHGWKKMYYQVNATYYSALGEDEGKLLAARAIQLFMPGKPQIWYLDLLAGVNDYEGMKGGGAGGHKEINRTNLTVEQVKDRLKREVVKKQMEMIRFRNTSPAFAFDADFTVDGSGRSLVFAWRKAGHRAVLEVDFERMEFGIWGEDEGRGRYFEMNG